jgi:hypothetical protein
VLGKQFKPYLRPVIEIAANTGLRRGNTLELRWDECDQKSGVIRKAKTKNNETDRSTRETEERLRPK